MLRALDERNRPNVRRTGTLSARRRRSTAAIFHHNHRQTRPLPESPPRTDRKVRKRTYTNQWSPTPAFHVGFSPSRVYFSCFTMLLLVFCPANKTIYTVEPSTTQRTYSTRQQLRNARIFAQTTPHPPTPGDNAPLSRNLPALSTTMSTLSPPLSPHATNASASLSESSARRFSELDSST